MGNLFSTREKELYTEKDFGEEIRESMSEYALYSAYDRSVPCIVDGLKPVQRRLLYTSWAELDQRPNGKLTKCARVVGDVLGKFHPHGDSGAYEALVNMTSAVTARYPLFFNQQGNFGDKPMGDGYAAMRYTETKIGDYGALFTTELDALSYAPNYDGTLMEPVFLCPSFPAFLMNESLGIGTGISGTSPGHNLVDICETTEYLLRNPQASDDELIDRIKAPDYALGGNIINSEGNRAALKRIYTQGRGTLYFEAKWHFERSDDPLWKFMLVVDEFCPGMTIASFNNGYLKTLVDKGSIFINDDSTGSDNVKIHIYANSNNVFLNDVLPQLRGFHRSYNMTAVDLVKVTDKETGEVRYEERLITATLRYIIGRWYHFRRQVLTDHFNIRTYRASQNLWKAELRKRLIEEEGLLDQFRKCTSQDDLDYFFNDVMQISKEQAEYVMRIQIGTLVRLNTESLQSEIDKLKADLEYFEHTRQNLMEYIIEEIRSIRVKYGDPRRTTLFLDQEEPKKEVVNYLISVKDKDFKLQAHDSWPTNGVGLTKTINAMVATDRLVVATYDGNMAETTAENVVSYDWWGVGAAIGDDDIMVMIDDQNKVAYRWVPEELTRRLRLCPNKDTTLIHACGINKADSGVVIRLNNNAWSFLSRKNLEGYAVDKPAKFWDYTQDKKTFATQVFRVGPMDDIVDANGQPISFEHDNDDLITDGQVFIVADHNFVYLKSGRISYYTRAMVFDRWSTILDIYPLGNKPINK